jgi:hypothetical protein
MLEEDRTRTRHGWMVIGMCAAFALCLGYIGFRSYFIASGDPRPALNLLYLALQLFTLESGSVPGHVPLTLDLARLAAPLIAAWAGLKVLFQVFRDEFAAFRLRRLHDHVIVCGLGDKALHYARDFAESSRVVVIERNPENERIHSVRALGAQVLVGDARLDNVLGQVRVERARYLVAITGDDFANIGIAEQARIMAERRKSGRLLCYTHVVNPQVLEAAKLHERLWDRTEKFVPNVFSIYREAARKLFETKPLDWRPIDKDSRRYVHLIIFGFGRMGENVLLQAARIGHLANRKRLTVTVVDKSAAAKMQSFLFRYSNLDKVCNVETLNHNAEDPRVIQAVRSVASDEHALVSVVICFKSDERNLAYAVGLKEKMEDQTFLISVRMSQEDLLCRVLGNGRHGDRGVGCHLAGFGTSGECCTSERLIRETQDSLAREIHERYRQTQSSEKGADHQRPSGDLALREWDMLREDFRESNRQQADHLPVKLRAVNCEYRLYKPGEARGSDGFNFTNEEIETMAIMEHNRWNAERWLGGWRKGPRDKGRMVTPHLVEWEELPEEVKKYDRDTVRSIPNLVKVSRRP